MADASKNNTALLLGMGLDGRDEHRRITRGDNFCLVGGSEETHEKMTETAVKFNEKLSKRGKRLGRVRRCFPKCITSLSYSLPSAARSSPAAGTSALLTAHARSMNRPSPWPNRTAARGHRFLNYFSFSY